GLSGAGGRHGGRAPDAGLAARRLGVRRLRRGAGGGTGAAGGTGGRGLRRRAGAGRAVVVDAGPDPRLVDGCLRRLGVSRVPLLVLTHFHADHVDGLAGGLAHREGGEVDVPRLAAPPDGVASVAAETTDAGVPTVVATYGA